tara:strand:+ start:2216 stop:2431 length:216 start_codon:yes stop_codon:yes gene_type:complete
MTKKPYYILFVYNTDTQTWFDEFGDYTKASLKTEIEFSHYDIKKKHIKIIKTTDDKNAIKTAYENLEREIA